MKKNPLKYKVKKYCLLGSIGCLLLGAHIIRQGVRKLNEQVDQHSQILHDSRKESE